MAEPSHKPAWADQVGRKYLAEASALWRKVPPGARIFIASACAQPQALLQSLANHTHHLTDVELFCPIPLARHAYAQTLDTVPRSVEVRANFGMYLPGPDAAMARLQADYTPLALGQLEAMMHSRRLPLDVALVSVTPPDEQGMCSLGISVDVTRAAIRCARWVIAQVNPQLPRIPGEALVHCDELDMMIEGDRPLPDWPTLENPDEDKLRAMAEALDRLMPDGSTVQVGIGNWLDAVVARTGTTCDLHIQTDRLGDGLIELIRQQRITGPITASFIAASHHAMPYVRDLAELQLLPSRITNDPRRITQQPRMVAINGAQRVDLTGQIAGDAFGSGPSLSGSISSEFILAAPWAEHGRSIIILPSTYRDTQGEWQSSIVPQIEKAGITAGRAEAQYVITEHGTACLQGHNIRHRALSLIQIAHPDVRSDLLHRAKRRRFVYADQIIPPPRQPYPQQYIRRTTLRDGQPVTVRPIRPDDESLIRQMFYQLSEQTIHLRMHTSMRSVSHERLQMFCNVDYDTEMALVATLGEPDHEQVIALSSYMADDRRRSAEVAFLVHDDYQRHGLGTVLFDMLLEIGQAHGIAHYHAAVLAENRGMMKIFRRADMHIDTRQEDGVYHIRLSPNTPNTPNKSDTSDNAQSPPPSDGR